jgi:hypothetical protein
LDHGARREFKTVSAGRGSEMAVVDFKNPKIISARRILFGKPENVSPNNSQENSFTGLVNGTLIVDASILDAGKIQREKASRQTISIETLSANLLHGVKHIPLNTDAQSINDNTTLVYSKYQPRSQGAGASPDSTPIYFLDSLIDITTYAKSNHFAVKGFVQTPDGNTKLRNILIPKNVYLAGSKITIGGKPGRSIKTLNLKTSLNNRDPKQFSNLCHIDYENDDIQYALNMLTAKAISPDERSIPHLGAPGEAKSVPKERNPLETFNVNTIEDLHNLITKKDPSIVSYINNKYNGLATEIIEGDKLLKMINNDSNLDFLVIVDDEDIPASEYISQIIPEALTTILSKPETQSEEQLQKKDSEFMSKYMSKVRQKVDISSDEKNEFIACKQRNRERRNKSVA